MSHASAESATLLATRARGLVQLLLTRLDGANECIDTLGEALETADAYRALGINAKLKRDLADAYLTILVLEQLSSCSEVDARVALQHSQRKARLLRIQAWSLASQLRDGRDEPEPNSTVMHAAP